MANGTHESLHGRRLELCFFYINILMKWKYQRKRLRNAFGTQCFTLFCLLAAYSGASAAHVWRPVEHAKHMLKVFFSHAIVTHRLSRENDSSLLLAKHLFKAANNQLLRAAGRGCTPSWVLYRLVGTSRSVQAPLIGCDFCQPLVSRPQIPFNCTLKIVCFEQRQTVTSFFAL